MMVEIMPYSLLPYADAGFLGQVVGQKLGRPRGPVYPELAGILIQDF